MPLIDLQERDVDKWTLRLVIERGALAFECRNCWHLSQVDVLGLVERFGAEALVSDLRRRARCRLCRSRRVRSLVRTQSRPERSGLGSGTAASGTIVLRACRPCRGDEPRTQSTEI
jgi:hypothetical protein